MLVGERQGVGLGSRIPSCDAQEQAPGRVDSCSQSFASSLGDVRPATPLGRDQGRENASFDTNVPVAQRLRSGSARDVTRGADQRPAFAEALLLRSDNFE